MKDLESKILIKPPRVGEIVEGKVIGKGNSAIYLDLGAVGTGMIYGKEFKDSKEELKKLKIGETLFAKIIDLENDEGYIEMSVSGASKERTFETLQDMKEKGEPIKVKILKANKGGLITEVSGISAFLPVSQLSKEHYPKVEGGDTTKILRELQNFIGKEMEVKILDLSQGRDQIILSEKAKDLDRTREILKNYNAGDVVDGEVTGVTDFGAFIKFNEDLEGLIHISEIDWKIIKDPSEVLKIGDKVKAKIIEISNGRVSLSLKALKKNPE